WRATAALIALGWVALCVAELLSARARTPRAEQAPGEPPPFAALDYSALLFCACTTLWYVVVALDTHGNSDNDSAYYFGVARHIARTGRFEEPIVWHFLSHAPGLPHAPFDYWQGLAALVLVPALWLFGPTVKVALIVVALIDGIGLALLWYLIAIAAPIRYRV